MGGRRQQRRAPEGRARIRSDGLELEGVVTPLHSAGFPYWELAPGRWAEAVDGLCALGIPALRLDLPWALHERAPGVFEWGARRPELDVERLLGLAAARGLRVLCRPGPWIPRAPGCDGIPERLATRGATGPHPPSCASEELLHEGRAWLRFVASRLERFVHPDGPVAVWIAAGPGPVPSPFGAGLLDRSDASLSVYARFVKVKYPPASTPVGLPPPGGPVSAGDLERSCAWIEAGEAAQRAAIEAQLELRPRTAGREALATLAAIPDTPIASGGDAEATRFSVDAVTLLFPDAPMDFRDLRLLGLRADGLGSVAGIANVPSSETLLEPAASLDPPTAAAVLAMSGTRALDLDTLIPRSAFAEFGAPLDRFGSAARGSGAAWRELFRSLAAIDHSALTRRSDLLLLANRELCRVREACSGPSPAARLGSREDLLIRLAPRELGLRDTPSRDHAASFLALFDGLRRAGIAFSVADTSVSAHRLRAERAVALVCFEHISRPLAKRLFEWVAEGGTLIIGPRLPSSDWMEAPLSLPPAPGRPAERKRGPARLRFGELVLEEVDLFETGDPVLEHAAGMLATAHAYGRGRIVQFGFRLPWGAAECDEASLTRILTALAHAAGIGSSYLASDPAVETEFFVGAERRFMFLANPTPQDRVVTVALGAGEAIREVRGAGEHLRAGEPLEIAGCSVLLRELVQL